MGQGDDDPPRPLFSNTRYNRFSVGLAFRILLGLLGWVVIVLLVVVGLLVFGVI